MKWPGRFKGKKHARSVDGWSNWKRHCKARWPIRWFFAETLPDFLYWKCWFPIQSQCERSYWWIRHRTTDVYHVVKCSDLEPMYHEQSTRMLHASFEMLNSYYEHSFNKRFYEPTVEELNREINDDGTYNEYYQMRSWYVDRIQINREIQLLWGWWNFIRPNRRDLYSDDCPPPPPGVDEDEEFMWPLSYKYKDTPEYAAYNKWAKQQSELEEICMEEDEEMFIRLVKIRKYLWS